MSVTITNALDKSTMRGQQNVTGDGDFKTFSKTISEPFGWGFPYYVFTDRMKILAHAHP